MTLCETKFALLTQKRLIWGVLRTLGDFSLAHAINQLRWASFVSPERCTAAVQQRSHRRGGQRTLGGPRTHKFRMQFPQRKNQCTPKNRRISTIRLQDLKYSPGNCMRNYETIDASAAGVEGTGGTCRGAGGRWRGLAGLRGDAPNSDQASLVWRAPEGPEGTGGLRGAAPNEVRPPSLAGGRARRRPEHQRSRKQQAQSLIPAAPSARTARGRAAAHRHTQRPGPQSTRGAQNTRGATSTTERRSLRTPRSTPGSGRPGGHRGGRAH